MGKPTAGRKEGFKAAARGRSRGMTPTVVSPPGNLDTDGGKMGKKNGRGTRGPNMV